MKRAGNRYVHHYTDIRLYLTLILLIYIFGLIFEFESVTPNQMRLFCTLQQHILYLWTLHNSITNPHRQLCPASLEALRKGVPVSPASESWYELKVVGGFHGECLHCFGVLVAQLALVQ